jgi:Putative Ig domain
MSYRASYFHGSRFFQCASLQRALFRCASFQCAALIAIVTCSLLFNGCSGGSLPGSNNSGGSSTATSTGSSTASLNISATLPGATVGAAYNSTITVTGGTSPYAFSVASGALPGGVALGATNGTVSGTPTASGNFGFTVSVTDSSGLSKQQSLQIAVASAPAPTPTTPSTGQSGGSSFSEVQHSGGWAQYGQQWPSYVDCSPSPCQGISFSMTQGVSSPSLSGKATEYYVGGNVPFSDALWNNHLIGANSSQGMPDANQTVVPSLHDFTYDVYFYGDNLGLSQALEFDINQFFGGMGFIFGHECRIASGNEWDVWDNQNAYWKHTGIPCNPNSNSWNHLTLKVQRTSNNQLVYQSITLNGVTSNLNWSFPAGSAPGWYGVTINYQMDGDKNQDSYNVYLDNLTFSYQ